MTENINVQDGRSVQSKVRSIARPLYLPARIGEFERLVRSMATTDAPSSHLIWGAIAFSSCKVHIRKNDYLLTACTQKGERTTRCRFAERLTSPPSSIDLLTGVSVCLGAGTGSGMMP